MLSPAALKTGYDRPPATPRLPLQLQSAQASWRKMRHLSPLSARGPAPVGDFSPQEAFASSREFNITMPSSSAVSPQVSQLNESAGYILRKADLEAGEDVRFAHHFPETTATDRSTCRHRAASISNRDLQSEIRHVLENHSNFLTMLDGPIPMMQHTQRRTRVIGLGKVYTRAQRRAIERFDEIDAHRAKREEVFEDIGDSHRRHEIRLEFFRDRHELVLPEIEAGFLSKDGQCVDVKRLQRKCFVDRRANAPAVATSAAPEITVQPVSPDGLAPGGEGLTTAPSGALQVAVGTSAQSLSTVFSVESLAQRQHRLADQRQLRNERLENVRSEGRRRALQKRCEMLEDVQRKATRQELAVKLRAVCVYLAVAAAAEVAHRMVQGWRGSLILFALTGHGSFIRSNLSVQASETDRLRLVAEGPLRRFNEMSAIWQQEAERQDKRDRVYKKLGHTLRCVLFVVRVKKKSVIHRCADTVRHFIEAAVRGHEARIAVRRYMTSIRKMQRLTLGWIQYRRFLHKKVYLPAIWEMETRELIANLPGFEGAMSRKSPTRSERKSSMAGLQRGKTMSASPARSEKRPAHTMQVEPEVMALLAKYRMSDEQRGDICLQLVRDGVSRWWARYVEYKLIMSNNKSSFMKWMATVHAVGLTRNDDAYKPPDPQPATYPEELKTVDPVRLQAFVLEALQPIILEAAGSR
eukprot:TRINITY_DN42363_c0_g1_i1.p1 TRINITY_DN42363_c0_g1~~TRINITY_DN42363_c0_g1_i1.p1  ORF type:complete len:695 (-),score=116.96 TRINITY_DN42363_c0_g1_i1:86-2170(-)